MITDDIVNIVGAKLSFQGNVKSMLELTRRNYITHVLLMLQIPECSAGIVVLDRMFIEGFGLIDFYFVFYYLRCITLWKRVTVEIYITRLQMRRLKIFIYV